VSTILCIDTASDRFALAVDRDGAMVSMEAEANQDHSRLLLPAIAGLVGDDELEAVLVVIGPGAYAGIRVGIATAEGLALARSIPVYGIGTLEAVALAAGFGEGLAIHPAGRGQFAAQRWVHGAPTGRPAAAEVQDLGPETAGEGAAAFGGRDVSPKERVEAALKHRSPAIRSGTLEAGAEAFYLREPNITISRRREAASS
jgi:tRNA threonylcarbamoyl adenosine modification protein YeaZ